MPVVDERVVEMRFDNKQFESNAQQSIKTVENLKNTLDFSSTTKSFDNLEKAASGIDFNPLGKAVEGVKEKFSAFEIAAITAIQNVTNRAVDAGVRIAKSLSIDQVIAGFQEYELKMGSVQTIMASTGESLETVNNYLDELNHYADKTIYSFSDMTRNIGKFTNAGVKLEDAVKAIQGISNEAAVSGANANEASRAMYNFAQALSSGSVKLIDWKSIENANMATVEFKQQLLDTALALGTVVKEGELYQTTTTDNKGSVSEWFNATKKFNDALSAQWMTTDVLVQTLSNYSTDVREMTKEEKFAYEEKLKSIGYTKEQIKGIEELGKKAFDSAQDVKTFSQLMDTLKESVGSGWAQTFEILIGDFEEAKQLWTNVNNVIGDIFQKQSDARNQLLQTWKDLGGRNDLIESIANVWRVLLEVVKPIKDAFTDIFPPITAQTLKNITGNLKSFTENLKVSDSTADKLKRTFSGLFSIVDILGRTFNFLFNLLSPLTKVIGYLASNILTVTANIGDWITNLDGAIKKNEVFYKALMTIETIVKTATDKMKEFLSVVKEWVGSHYKSPDLSFISDFADLVEIRISPLKAVLNVVGGVLAAIVGIFAKITPYIISFTKLIGKALSTLGTKIVDAFNSGGINAVLDLFNTGVIAAIIVKVNKFIETISNLGLAFADAEGFEKFKEGIIGVLEAIQASIKADVLKKIAISIAILTASLIALTLVNSEKLAGAVSTIAGLFIELFGGMGAFSKLINFNIGMIKMSSIMVSLSVSIVILASALVIISKIDSEKLASSLGVLTALLAEMAGVAILLSKFGGKIKSGSIAMIALAASVLILSDAVKKLGELQLETIGKGLLALLGVLGELALFMIAAKFGKLSTTQAASIAIIAKSLLMFQEAIELFGKLDSTVLTNGLAAFTAIMSELSLFAIASKFGKMSLTQSVGIIILAESMKIFQEAIEAFGKLDLDVLIKGLVAVTAILTELVASNILISKFGSSNKMIGTALSMVILAEAMKLLEEPLQAFGKMSWEELAKGFAAMAVALTEFATAANFMPKNMVAIGLGIIEMALAIESLSKSLMTLSGMSWEEIARGLAALGGGLAELAIATKLMNGAASGAAAILMASVALLALAPVIKTLSGLSWTGVLTALATLAGTFTILGVTGALLAPISTSILALSAALVLLGVGVTGLGAGLILVSAGLSSIAVSGVATASALVAMVNILLAGILDAIANSVDALGRAVSTIIGVVCDAILKNLPTLVNTVLSVTLEILKGLVEYTPDIVHEIINLIVGILDALTKDLPKIVDSIFDFVEALFSSVLDRLKQIDGKKMLESIIAIGALSLLVAVLAGIAVLTPAAMVGVAGLAGVVTELGLLFAAFGTIIDDNPDLKYKIDLAAELMNSIGNAIGKFISGIVTGITDSFPKIAQDLSNFMTNLGPFIDGANKISPGLMDGVKSLVEVILLLTAADVVNSLTSWLTGGSSLSDFGKDLSKFGKSFSKYYEQIKNVKPEVINASVNAAKSISEMAKNLPNQGGVVSWFVGDNTLSVFAEELISFGSAMKKYSKSIENIKPEAVIASANAAKVISEMSATLPNQGGVVSWFVGDNTLSTFAEELIPFGKAVKKYANSIAGIDVDTVVASTHAANSLFGVVKIAKELPNQGGVVSWFVGDNTLADFAEELVPFGEAVANYVESIRGIDATVVMSSTCAAKAVEEVVKIANELPNKGGVVSWFTGDNTLSDFAKELDDFGPAVAKYAKSVASIDDKTVTASKNAAESLSCIVDMASKLPNQGGVVSWFVGDNTLSMFAKDLEAFGLSMVNYSNNVSGINPLAVAASASAASILVTLAQNIPDTGGLVSWFTGDNDFKTFGEQLKSFGEAMRSYSDSVMVISEKSLTTSIEAAGKLIDLAERIDGFNNLNSLSNFGTQLTKMGQEGIKSFVTAFETSQEQASKAVDIFLGYVSTAIKYDANNVYTDFNQIGQTIPSQLGSGITSQQSRASGPAEELINNVLDKIHNPIKNDDFKAMGSSIASSLGVGISNEKYLASSAASSMATDIKWSINNVISGNSMKTIGTTITSSLRKGIEDGRDVPINEASSMAWDIYNNIHDTLGYWNFYNIGSDLSNGLYDGMNNYRWNPINQASDISWDISNGIKQYSNYWDSYNTGSDLSNGIYDGMNNNRNAPINQANSISYDIYKTINGNLSYKTIYDIGKNVISGLKTGISDGKNSIIDAAKSIANSAIDAAKNAFGIHSPSRVFTDMGENTTSAFANSVFNNLYRIINAGKQMAQDFQDPVQYALDRLVESIEDDDYDYNPTITPILNLENVIDGANQVSSIFNGIDATKTIDLANATSSGFLGKSRAYKELNSEANVNDKLDKLLSEANLSKTENTNTFYIQSTDPKKAAEEVGYIMQHKVERGKATWAK